MRNLTLNTTLIALLKLESHLNWANELMHPNLWPQGCIVGKYRAPRNKPTIGLDHSDKHEDHFLDLAQQTVPQK